MELVADGRHAVRLGFRLVAGLRQAEAEKFVQEGRAGYLWPSEVMCRAASRRPTMMCLAQADCFRSMGMDRRQALWHAKAPESCSEGQVIHVIANQFYDWSSKISKLHRGAQNFALCFGRGDVIARGSGGGAAKKRPKPSTNEMGLKSRDFRSLGLSAAIKHVDWRQLTAD